jgi:hypothetical protein
VSIGAQMWMVSHFNLSVRKRQFDWNELLRKGEAFEVMKDMNGDKASNPMGCSQNKGHGSLS